MKQYLKQKAIKLLEWLKAYLELMRYWNANYSTHWEVRASRKLLYIARIAFQMLAASVFFTGVLAVAVLVKDYGGDYFQTPLALLAISILRETPSATPATALASAVMVLVISSVLGVLVWNAIFDFDYRPIPLTDDELTELRMCGYIVMEAEDYEAELQSARQAGLNEAALFNEAAAAAMFSDDPPEAFEQVWPTQEVI